MNILPGQYTAFGGTTRLAAGTLADAARAVVRAMRAGDNRPLLIFDDRTGRVVDIDWRGTEEEVAARYTAPAAAPDHAAAPARGPGRPRLGVVAREVTLLPAQWDWLAQQPGGASVTLRKLVDRARRETADTDAARQARENAYRFLHAVGGDLPHFEELSRALFAGDEVGLHTLLEQWPADVRAYAVQLLAIGHALPDGSRDTAGGISPAHG
jgi:hypothetical protein